MNKLGKIALDRLIDELNDAAQRVQEATPENFEHRKPYIASALRRATEVAYAIKEPNRE